MACDAQREPALLQDASTRHRSPDAGDRARWRGRPLAWVVTVAAVCGGGCGDVVRTGRSPAVLVLNRLEGAPGAEPGAFSTVVQSDVETWISRGVAGETDAWPAAFTDPGRAELRLVLKDAGPPGSPTSPTDNNALTITRYRVSYRRTDGRNTPGVDVPHAFDGAATVTVHGSEPAAIAFELVRMQAKLEPPLRALRGGGGAVAISAVADVTFLGRDLVGRDVAASGSMSVVFADWPDPE